MKVETARKRLVNRNRQVRDAITAVQDELVSVNRGLTQDEVVGLADKLGGIVSGRLVRKPRRRAIPAAPNRRAISFGMLADICKPKLKQPR